MTLLVLDFLGLAEPGIWGLAVLVSGVGGSERIRSGGVELRLDGSPVFVWESLGRESRVWESEGCVSEVKVAVVMGSGARGYEERRFGVKGSEKSKSGVSGCVVKSIGGGGELPLLVLASSLAASLLASPCVAPVSMALRWSKLSRPPPVWRRRENRSLDTPTSSRATPLLALVSPSSLVELTDSLVVRVVVIVVEDVVEEVVWSAEQLATGSPLGFRASNAGKLWR